MILDKTKYYVAEINDLCIGLNYYVKAKGEKNYREETIRREVDYIHFLSAFLSDDYEDILIKKLDVFDLTDLGFKRAYTTITGHDSKDTARYILYKKGDVLCDLRFNIRKRNVVIKTGDGYIKSDGIIKNKIDLYNELKKKNLC